jgi:phosphate-selective porin OprO/OprP
MWQGFIVLVTFTLTASAWAQNAEFTPIFQSQHDLGWVLAEPVGKENADYRLRRQRIGANGLLPGGEWGYRLSIEVSSGEPELRDGYVSYRGIENFYAALGHTREAHGIYEKAGNQWLHFLERPTGITVFQPRRTYGLLVSPHDTHWTLQAGIHGEGTGRTGQNNTGRGLTGRAVWRPWVDLAASEVLHFGVNTRYREPNEQTLDFQANGQEAMLREPLVDTGTLVGVDHYHTVAGEFYYTDGPLALLSEARMARVEREGSLSDPVFWGGSAQITYFLTGEQREYQLIGSTFGKVAPRDSMWDGGIGAWEVGLRVDTVDLQDEDVQGGRLYSGTLGVSWWPVSRLRLMANYVYNVTDQQALPERNPQYFLTRVQIAF